MPPSLRLSLCVAAVLLPANASQAGVPEGEAAIKAGDYLRAAKEFTQTAENGDAAAQMRLGSIYESLALQDARDKAAATRYEAQAFAWYVRAASQNAVNAQRRVAEMLRGGIGAAKDDARAAEWDRKATTILRERAEKGDASAQLALARACKYGRGTPANLDESMSWRRKAARQGSAEAFDELGVQYARGDGVEKNPVLAYAMFAIAARISRDEGGQAVYLGNLEKTGAELSAAEREKAKAIAEKWRPGDEAPTLAE